MRWIGLGKLAALMALAVAVPLSMSPGPARAVTVTDDASCWTILNELAAAAVFADLSDEKLESVYALLDQLQDHCEARAYEEATKTTQAIEILVGK